MLDLLFINGIIITMDANHTIYENGYLGITKDKITCLGSMETTELPLAKQVIDLEGKPILPGLVDGHGHAGHCMTRTIAEHLIDDWEHYAESIYYLYSDEAFWYIEGALAAMERLKFGVTSAVSMVGNTPRIDRIWPIKAHLEGSLSTGIRQYSGIGTANEPWPKYARTYTGSTYTEYEVKPEEAIVTCEEAVKTLNDIHPRGTCIVAPGRMGLRLGYTEKDNIYQNKEMYRIASYYHQPIHTHAFGGDVAFLKKHTPEILDYNLSLTHSTGYSDEELDILSKSKAYVFHGPTTHSHIMNWCPVWKMLKKGIHVAIVTDGSAPDRSFDLWRDMKNVQILQRAHEKDYSLLPCGKVLEMATIEPAKALGIDSIVGSLEVGKKADIIRINTNQPHLTPFVKMPIQRLVQYAMGQDVDLVVVDGIIVMQDRKLTQIDENDILKKATEIFNMTMNRLNQPIVFNNPNLFEIKQ